MAKVTQSSVTLEVDTEELALIVRGLKALTTYETASADEDKRVRSLVADIQSGA